MANPEDLQDEESKENKEPGTDYQELLDAAREEADREAERVVEAAAKAGAQDAMNKAEENGEKAAPGDAAEEARLRMEKARVDIENA